MSKRQGSDSSPSVAIQASREALSHRIARWTEREGLNETAIVPLLLSRRGAPTMPTSYMYEPSVCLIAQGTKRVILGEDMYVLDGSHLLVVSVDLPTVVQIIRASEEKPYLGLILKLDRRDIAQLSAATQLPPRSRPSTRSMATTEVTLPLLTAFQRLLDLLDDPNDIPILAPIIQQEILYRLLMSEQGEGLRQTVITRSQSHQIGRSIDWLKSHFTEPLRIDDLAEQVNMSASTFHHHFRKLTAMSPLQYQKWLRLNEARRLMLTDRLDASTAGFRVGYESPSQFSREYSRLFGAPPLRDITNLLQR